MEKRKECVDGTTGLGILVLFVVVALIAVTFYELGYENGAIARRDGKCVVVDLPDGTVRVVTPKTKEAGR